jgi:hypothetical protein
MEPNKLIFCLGLGIFIILIAVNIRLDMLELKFDKYCTVQYNISAPCPCESLIHDKFLNISGINLSRIKENP